MPVTAKLSAVQLKWDAIYANQHKDSATAPSDVLLNNLHLLPSTPHQNVLEIACGLGANTFLLASKGFTVDAWDISPVAIQKLKRHPSFSNNISAISCDVLQQDILENGYDIIIISRFLERTIIPNIIAGLKPNGILFYQTFLKKNAPNTGPKNPLFLLNNNELPSLFSSLNVLFYQENITTGEPKSSSRNEAMMVAQKPNDEDNPT